MAARQQLERWQRPARQQRGDEGPGGRLQRCQPAAGATEQRYHHGMGGRNDRTAGLMGEGLSAQLPPPPPCRRARRARMRGLHFFDDARLRFGSCPRTCDEVAVACTNCPANNAPAQHAVHAVAFCEASWGRQEGVHAPSLASCAAAVTRGCGTDGVDCLATPYLVPLNSSGWAVLRPRRPAPSADRRSLGCTLQAPLNSPSNFQSTRATLNFPIGCSWHGWAG